MKICLITALAVLPFIYACRSKQNEMQGKLLDEKRMQAVLWDVVQAGAFTQNYITSDSAMNDSIENASLQKKIFELHKTTREDFYYSYNYYSLKPAAMKKILDSILAVSGRGKNKAMMERYGGHKPTIETQ